MKKIYFLFLLCSTFCFSQNVVTEGSLENWTANSPDGWTVIDSGITLAENTSIFAEGAKSAQVTVTTGSQSSTDFRTTANVVNGVTYDVSFQVYQLSTDNDARARVFVDGNYGSYSNPATTDEWQTVTTTYTATADETIEVGARFYDVSGFDGSTVMYVDGFSMIDQTLSTNDIVVSKFSIYPNPTSTGFINIKGNNSNTMFIQVFDVLGKRVLNQSVSNERLNVSTLKTGVYIMKISQDNNTATKKLVIK